MTYQEAIDYLYARTPAFHNIGAGAYKEGLSNTKALDEHFGHPHRFYRTIHVAGTNGKGSCSHTLAAILQAAGYRVGLYTSPHLLDFSERIRINGEPISHDYVVRFVEQERSFFEPLNPSFFEVTTALAFRYFADEKVDVAVVEVGLGGRLDCTNIIRPDLSIITNISLEHTAFLGDTLAKIANEKAGIIKEGVPVVVGETNDETRPVFLSKAREMSSPIRFAENEKHTIPEVMQLKGSFQTNNARTILTAVDVLRSQGYTLSDEHIKEGFAHVCDLTGLKGRWQKLQERPTVICDIGHNPGCMPFITEQLKRQLQPQAQLPPCAALRVVLGFVNDKDIRPALNSMPTEGIYYLTQPSVTRALPSEMLYYMARCYGLNATRFSTVTEAYHAALSDASADDFIFVGGSNFVVADLLKEMSESSNNR